MEKKIVFMSLADLFGSKVASTVADDLSLFFLDLDKFIEYNMFDPSALLERCGVEHYKKQENRALIEAFDYEKTIYYSSFELFSNNVRLFMENKFIVVYIALSRSQLENVEDKNLAINKIAFSDRDAFMRNAHLIIENEFAVMKSFALKAEKYLGFAKSGF